MELVLLGTGTALPHARRGASGYALVASSGEVLLLECGPGSTRRWPSAGFDLTQVRAVLVTHYHVDHCADLPAVLFARQVPDPPVVSPLALLGPRGHARHLALLEELYGPAVALTPGVHEVGELGDGDAVTVGPFAVSAREVAHTPGALGVRVRCDGRTLAFSGDSAPCDALVALCRGADLALLESSYPAARAPSRSHLRTTDAASTARDAGVGRLVLAHFYPACDDCDLEAEVRDAGFRGELTLGIDGLRVTV